MVPTAKEHHFHAMWGDHTLLIWDVLSGIGIAGIVCLVIMVMFVPFVASEEDDPSHWRRIPYKEPWARKPGFFFGALGFAGCGIWIVGFLAYCISFVYTIVAVNKGWIV